jgi:hypothetical protein
MLFACKKTSTDFIISDGKYVGTFQRLTPAGGQISTVSITFSGNTWTGQSQVTKYPALCNGTYKTNSSDSATFENDCFWTAEFDWTLILKGDYQVKIDGKALNMSRDYSNGSKDIYLLKKE